jgi:hypothetical protein
MGAVLEAGSGLTGAMQLGRCSSGHSWLWGVLRNRATLVIVVSLGLGVCTEGVSI